MRHIYILFLFFVILFTLGCKEKVIDNTKVPIENSNRYIAIADTIVNDIIIKNPEDDSWKDYCLRNLNKDLLVDKIFEAVYNKTLIPHDFFNETPLSIEEIKALEKNDDFSRDKIAKVQFEEAWYYDAENQKMIKKVYSIMLAYEVYNSNEEIKGYKPAFKIYLK